MLKIRWVCTFAAVAMLAACTSYGTTGADVSVDGTDQSMSSDRSAPYLDESSVSSDDSVEIDVNADASASVSATTGSPRVIAIAVSDWAFTPSMITAKKGEKVQLQLTGGTGIHSFAVPALGMNVRVEPGQTVTVDLPTDTAGTFDAMCRIPCGAGHKDMKATIVIS